MKLLTETIKKTLPPLYSTELIDVKDKIVRAKFFDAQGSWRWYVVEGSEQPDGDWIFFGYVEGFENEWGYFTLYELMEARGPMGIQRIERDLYGAPKTMREVL